MSINIIYVSQLPSLTEVQGNDYIVGYSPSLGKNVRISVNTLRKGVGVPLWDPSTALDPGYATDFIVEWQLKFWKSLINNNHDIPTEGASWTEVSSDGSGVNNSYRGAYDPDAVGANGYPDEGGSGIEGAIQGGDEWYIPAGLDPVVINGEEQDPGTLLKALVNNPGQTHTNWRLV
jgi:hypothetical protein